MRDYQREFLLLAIGHGALRFGEFELKSGRISPYFFNMGALHSGSALAGTGRAYAAALVDSPIDCDMLFGPAYKGIPLVATTAVALATHHARDLPWAFDRKEEKTHGEGGGIVGAPLTGRVVIIDDVLTAGTAVRQAAGIIRNAGAEVAGVLTALDREERSNGDDSAAAAAGRELEVPVASIVGLSDILAFLGETGEGREQRERIAAYRARYGA